MRTGHALFHDVAFAGAHAFLDALDDMLPEGRRPEAFTACYNGLRGACEALVSRLRREALGLTPSKN